MATQGTTGEALTTTGGTSAIAITGANIAAGAQVVQNRPGRLCSILVTTLNGANPIPVTDGVGGTIIGIVPANAAVGTVITPQAPAAISINIPQTAAAGNLTITVY